jgi:hypothetical protein
MAESNTDKRIDDLRSEMYRGFETGDRRFDQVDARFDQVDRRFDRVEADVRELRAEMKEGFDSLHRLMIRLFAGTLGSVAAGIIVLLASHS